MDIEETQQRRRVRPREDLDEPSIPLPRVRGGKKLSLQEKAYAYVRYTMGHNVNKISRDLGRSWKAVNNVVIKGEDIQSLDDQYSLKGRWKKGSTELNARQKNLIETWLSQDSVSSTMDAWRRILTVKSTPDVCYQVVHKYINTLGSWVKPRLQTILSQNTINNRFEYSVEHIDNTFEDTLFTDESTFELNSNYSKVFQFNGQRYPTRPKYNPNHSQMVWAGINYNGKTWIYFVNGWLNNQTYKELLIRARRDILKFVPED